ncbi:VanW family protein [Paenibacillus sp. Leaf72]|uniref:VanW family protein n=1 Tax=Paenibacillus sp. Leaf72 TaxID=1736234 RepID=UPI0007C7B980|nr:VanW family protein [Paenibacillus sp. Leaf72]
MKKLHLISIFVFALLLAASVSSGGLTYYAEQRTVPAGVTAGGLNIGGLPIPEAIKLLNDYEQALGARELTVATGNAGSDRRTWKAEAFGYKADTSEVRRALQQLGKGELWEAVKYRYHFPRNFELAQTFDQALFEKLIRQQWGWLEQNEPKDAARIITDQDEIFYEPEAEAYRIEMSRLSADVKSWLWLAADAKFPAEQAAYNTELPILTLSPSVTLEQLKAQGVERKLMSFTTDFAASAEGRAYNVASTAAALDNWLLAPGEIFDYSKVIRRVEEKYGFREAPVILNGKLVPGIGGGICQVSSTLYNAALRAGLEIVERRNHSLPVSYLPVGQDATYADGAINFRFRNSTDKYIVIRATSAGRKLTIKLFGKMSEDVQYRIESVTVGTLSPEVQQLQDPALPAGTRKVIAPGRNGYVVDTFRVTLENGKPPIKERISRDTYRAQPTVIHIGTGKAGGTDQAPAPQLDPAPNAPSTPNGSGTPTGPLLEDGIS